MIKKSFWFSIILTALIFIFAFACGKNDTTVTLKSIVITPNNASIASGKTQQFIAIGTYSDNNTKDLTNQAAWSSSKTNFASINSDGLATAIKKGITVISANMDNLSASTSLTVTDSINSMPVANAGPDQTVFVTNIVTLNGSGSADADGNSLTYSWSFVSKPNGSTASLINQEAVNPTFVVDKPGSYIIQLIVNDGFINSALDTIIISTENSAPIANSGTDQTVFVTNTVTLDGAGSTDVDGNPLTYNWSFISKPDGSTASLVNTTAINPNFIVDKFGSFIVQLIVNDGIINSTPDTITISTDNSTPVANAGSDQTVFVKSTVSLNGSGSTDVDGDTLTYSWSFVSMPVGSTAAFLDPKLINPMFIVDILGTYVAQLTITDSAGNTSIDTVTISTENSAPIANAGPDQTAFLTGTVNLDGAGSTDVDGNPLTYNWSFISKPEGSTASLMNTTTVNTNFIVDKKDNYVVQLIVNDGIINSAPDTIIISTENSPPVADAGTDQKVFVTNSVNLIGTGSTDVDGNLLIYIWSFTSKPNGSTASLVNPSAINQTFVADKFGNYVAQLIVNDGIINSTPDTITISTENTAPVANAGTDQTVFVTTTVFLSGSGSTDVDDNSLTYNWTFSSKPNGSTASLINPGTVNPRFVVDKPGNYVVQLIVNDGIKNSSPDTITISTKNSAPVASAGNDQTVFFSRQVTLVGSGTKDVDNDPLTYTWSIISKPTGSNAVLSNPAAINPTFTADSTGIYVAQLIVNDGTVNSAPDTVTITANKGTFTLTFLNINKVGMNSSAKLGVTISMPAPAGGITVTVLSDATNRLTVSPSSTVLIPEYETTKEVTLNGIALGNTIVRVNAPNFIESTLNVEVVSNFITTTPTLDVPLGQTINFPVTIAPNLAPVGGVVINIVSNDPSRVEVQTSTITIPEGANSANGTLFGKFPGTTAVIASNPDYALGASQVSTTASLDIIETNVSFTGIFSSPQITIKLKSAGSYIQAPSPININMTSTNSAGVSVTSPVTIQAGFESTVATLTWGGTNTLPSIATITAGAVGITSDNLTATVNSPGLITVPINGTIAIGSGLQNGSYSATLGASDHGGIEVYVSSNNPSIALVSHNSNSPGQAYMTTFISNGQTGVYFDLQGREGITSSTNATITISTPPGFFPSNNFLIKVEKPGLKINLPNSTTSLSPIPFSIFVGVPRSNNTDLQDTQAIRNFDNIGVTATITSSNIAVGKLLTNLTSPDGAGTVNIEIPEGSSSSPVMLLGGVEFKPMGIGTTTISASIPGFTSTTAATVTVTVSAP